MRRGRLIPYSSVESGMESVESLGRLGRVGGGVGV